MDRVTGTGTHKVNCPELPRQGVAGVGDGKGGGLTHSLLCEGMMACEFPLRSQFKQEQYLRSNDTPKGLFTKVTGKQRADK